MFDLDNLTLDGGRIHTFSADSSLLVLGEKSYSNTLYMIDLEAGQKITQVDTNQVIFGVALSQDKRTVFTVGSSGQIEIWQVSGH